jgi:TolA-binding protein
MKKRILLILSLIFSVAAVALAQTKTVTNADLEKFRQKRLEAERDYRENYAKLGFPSPQELEKQIAEEQRELGELSDRLRAERLERERTEALKAQIDWLASQNNSQQSQTTTRVERNYFYGVAPYFYYYNLPRYRPNYNRRKRYWRSNNLPPIRPPKPIRPPRSFGFPYRRR